MLRCKLNIKTPNPHQCAWAAGNAAAKSHKVCWACGDHSPLKYYVVSELSKDGLLSINALHHDENPETDSLQHFFWEGFKINAPLCESCDRHKIFENEMFTDPTFVEIAKKAGTSAGRENGGCVGCGRFNDQDQMDQVIVQGIHPTKPLLKIGKYEGERVHEIQMAFIEGYHTAAPQSCSYCQPDEE